MRLSDLDQYILPKSFSSFVKDDKDVDNKLGIIFSILSFKLTYNS